jgi:hypothetical protein
LSKNQSLNENFVNLTCINQTPVYYEQKCLIPSGFCIDRFHWIHIYCFGASVAISDISEFWIKKTQNFTLNMFFCGIIRVRVMLFNATFNYISIRSLVVSFIGGGDWSTRRKPATCCKSLSNFFITECCIKYTLPWVGFVLINLGIISNIRYFWIWK